MGVAPSHGFDGRIGIAVPADVAQPQSQQRHAEPEASTSRTRFPVRRPPKCRVHSRIGIGTGLRRQNGSLGSRGVTPRREPVDHRFRRRDRKRGPEFGEPGKPIRKHGIGFDTAKRIFEGTIATWPDRRRDYGEERRISMGRVEPGALIVVAHTERRGRIRLISALPASRKERRVYHERTLR